MLMPVTRFVLATVGALVRLEMVLLETFVLAPEKFTDIPVTLAAPVEMVLNVFPVIVLVGPLADEAPSVLLHPATIVAPVSVTFEKLFPVCVMLEPFTEEALAV